LCPIRVAWNCPHHFTVTVDGTSLSSKAATGVLKSRRFAMQLAPIGPRPGSSNFWP